MVVTSVHGSESSEQKFYRALDQQTLELFVYLWGLHVCHCCIPAIIQQALCDEVSLTVPSLTHGENRRSLGLKKSGLSRLATSWHMELASCSPDFKTASGPLWHVLGSLIWRFPKMMVPSKSSILKGCSIINHPAIGVPHVWNPPYDTPAWRKGDQRRPLI